MTAPGGARGATRLGFGASGAWAARWFPEEQAYAVLRAGVLAGVRDVDTGPSYARGHAEARLGRLLRRLEGEGHARPRVSTKVGTRPGPGGRPVKAFGADAIRRQLEASLSALGLPALDVLYLHGPGERQLASSLPVLAELKGAGLVGAVGVCTDGRHVGVAAEAAGVDWVMAPYNLLAPANAQALRAARAAGMRVCTVAPLAQALWRRDVLLPRSLPGAWYAARALVRSRDRLRAARRARWLREVPGWSPAELSVAFVREALGPDLVLTTSTNPAHVEEVARALARPVPDDLRDRLRGPTLSA